MRLLRKRQCLCFSAVVASLVLVSLMLTETVVLDPSGGSLRWPASSGLRGYPTISGVLDQQAAHSCKPVKNIAFIKTHKAGSSTIANILQRFGLSHDLNFALPNTKYHSFAYNYISKPGEILTKDKIVPLPPGQQEYNVLFHHAIYNRTAFRSIMPLNTSFISILREPFEQFVSAFEYYGIKSLLSHFSKDVLVAENPISEFLSNPEKYAKGPVEGSFSYIRNKQAEDLGFGEQEHRSSELLQKYIAQMDQDFVLIMIMERFQESLLLLRKALCWDMKDILYVPINKNANKPARNFTVDDHIRYQNFSHIDYVLYSHYSKIFEEKIASQSKDFVQELDNYEHLLDQVKSSCGNKRPLSVPETRWYSAFNVTLADCQLMFMQELVGLDRLYVRAGRELPFESHGEKTPSARQMMTRKGSV